MKSMIETLEATESFLVSELSAMRMGIPTQRRELYEDRLLDIREQLKNLKSTEKNDNSEGSEDISK